MGNGAARNQRQGSAVSTKELGRAAVEGRRLILTFTSGARVEGYLAGMDDYHWKIVDPDGGVLLIHKSAPEIIRISDADLDQAENATEIKAICDPFRKAMEREALGKTPKKDEIIS